MSVQRIVVTSLSPKMFRGFPASSQGGQDHQQRCVRSWLHAGATVVSVNNEAEIAVLTAEYEGVQFVRSGQVMGPLNPKGLPSLSEMLQVGIDLAQGGSFALANSDVEFRGDSLVFDALFEASTGGVVFSNRFECAPHTTEPGLPYLYGYDFFIFDSRLVSPGELDGFTIGTPWWDYLLLYLMAARDLPLAMITSPVIAHSTHDAAWSVQGWTLGLRSVAKRIRQLAEEEGPVAALLGHICRGLEPEAKPGFVTDMIVTQLGTVLGTAMVGYIVERCNEVLWFDMVEEGDTFVPRGEMHRAYHEAALVLVGDL